MNQNEENLFRDSIINPDDYDEATNTLINLKYINRELAEKLALEILEDLKGDPHFQASAFEILYSINQPAGLNFIRARLKNTNKIMFQSMIECVTEDSALLDGNLDMLETVKALKAKIETLDSTELENIKDTVDWFNATFKSQFTQ